MELLKSWKVNSVLGWK